MSKIETIWICAACREVHKTHTRCVGCDASTRAVRPYISRESLIAELDRLEEHIKEVDEIERPREDFYDTMDLLKDLRTALDGKE